MIVEGIHIYAGGFAVGLDRLPEMEFIGSYETYLQPMPLRQLLNIPRLSKALKADVVIANPPCSRFSHMMVGAYSDEDRSCLSNFKELEETVKFTMEADAKVLWWETGPLAATKGEDLIAEVSNTLADFWKTSVTTVIVSLDLLHTGLPQRRPRTHILHFRGTLPPPPVEETRWPEKFSLREYLDVVTAKAPRRDPVNVFLRKAGKVTDALWYTTLVRTMTGGFESTKPIMYDRNSTHSVAVLGGRFFSWKEDNRFWNLPEYTAVMGYPVNLDWYSLYPERTWHSVFGLMTRSVSPYASRWVATNVLLPMLEERPAIGSILPNVTNRSPLTWRYKLVDHRVKSSIVKFEKGEYDLGKDGWPDYPGKEE